MGKSSVGFDHQPVKTTNRVLNVLQMLHSYQMQCSASTSHTRVSRSDVNLISCMCQTKPIPAWGNNAGTCRAGRIRAASAGSPKAVLQTNNRRRLMKMTV